eukprot:353576_1
MSTPRKEECYALDDINVSFLDKTKQALPLVLTPRFDDSLEFLCKWAEANRPWVEEQILKYGAVLIRGFQVGSAPAFEKAILSLQPNLCNSYRGTSPRSLMEGTRYAFSAADVPVNYPIAQHIEMSFLNAPPQQIYFGCLKESKSAVGGETSLCDFRKLYHELSPALRNKLITKKIKYQRTHSKVGERFTFDVGGMLSWVDLFKTSDKQKVEKICKEEDAPIVQWIGANQDTFLQEWVDEPFQLHPVTREHVWFNHTQVFHWTAFPCELWYACCRVRDIRLFLHFVFVSIYNVVIYGLLGYKMALDSTFGDGKPISFQEMNEIRDVIHKNMVFSRWSKGDILCIDNFSTSHGRQPTYDKGRKVIVSWSHLLDKHSPSLPSRPSEGHKQSLKDKQSLKNDDNLPELSAVTPATSPESTLTDTEVAGLQSGILDLLRKDVLQSEADKKSRFEGHKRHLSCPALLQADSDFWKKIQ